MSVASSLVKRPLPGTALASLTSSPILGQSRKLCVAEGASLAEMAAQGEPDAFARRYLVAYVDGVEVPVDVWMTTRPKGGQVVNLVMRVGDGDFFRTVLQIAVIAVATWVNVSLGGIPGALASAAISIGGNLLINALVPLEVPGANSTRPEPFFTVTGARNQARLYEPVPLVLGRHRFFPPLWGQPIQETVGNDIYLRVPFCFGPAPMQISDIKIGETLLSAYDGVELETRLDATDPAHLLYAGDPDQNAVGALITTSFQERSTSDDVDEIEVVFGFRRGLGGIDSKGRKVSKSVTFIIEYRVSGSGEAWQSVRPTAVQASAASAELGEPDRSKYLFAGNLLTWAVANAAKPEVAQGPLILTRADVGRGFQYRVNFAVPRSASGYDVQLRRTTVESVDSSSADQAYWEVLGSRKSFVDPFPQRKLASGVLRIKASEQLSGVIDTFNFLAEPMVPVFSSAALASPADATADSLEAPAVSRNPAHLILNVYRGPQNARPRSDAKINWPSFAVFAKFCDDNDLHFDEVINGAMTRAELSRRIAQAGYGRLHKWGGKLAVAIDCERTGQAPSQTFTTRNISNLRWHKSFAPDVHAVRIEFANEDNGYQVDEVTLYLDGYSEFDVFAGETLVTKAATKFESLQVPGKTNADEVRIVGRQYINNSLSQTEKFTFDMDAEALTCKPGAYTLLQHDVMGTGLGAQRVKSLVMDGADVAGFVLDHPIRTEAGPTLGCRWRFMDEAGGEAWFEASDEVVVTRDADDASTFTFAAPRDAAVAPSVGDMVLVGETEQVALEVLVRDISPDVGHRASLVVIPYAPKRFAPDGTPLPPHDPKVTLPIGARPPQPVLLTAKARAREIVVSFVEAAMPRGVTLTNFEVAVRETGDAGDSWSPLPSLRADERVAVAPAGDTGAQYDVRIIAVGRDSGGLSVYSDPLIVSEIDADAAPTQPAGCAATFQTRTSTAGASQLVLVASWTANEDPDILDTAVEMLVSTGPDVWAEIGRARAAVGSVEVHGLQVGRGYNLGFTNLSRRGAPSVRTTITTIMAPDTLVATGAVTAVPGSELEADIAAAAISSDAAAAAAEAAASAAAIAEANAATAAADSAAARDLADAAAAAAAISSSSAGASATTATGAASTATTQAGNAASSASAANTAKVAAQTAETNSAASAAASATSASSAAASNTAAGTSASAANTAKLAAETAQAAALVLQTSAATSATGAAGSAAAASTSAALSASYATAAGAGTRSFDFQLSGSLWTNAVSGAPTAVADPTGATYPDLSTIGRVHERGGAYNICTKYVLQPVPGRSYRISARVRRAVNIVSGSATISLDAYRLSETYGGIGNASGGGAVTVVQADGWVIISAVITATNMLAGSATYIRPRVETNGDGASTVRVQSVWIEDVTDVAATNATITSNQAAQATINSAQAVTNTGVTTRFAANAAASQNYLRNSTFRDGLTNWITYGSPSAGVNADSIYASIPYGALRYAYQDFRVQDGDTYSMAGELYRESSGNNSRMYVQWLDEPRTSSFGYGAILNAATNGWTRLYYDGLVPPSGTKWARVYVDNYDGTGLYGSGSGESAFRRLTFTRSAYNQPWSESDGLALGLETHATITSNQAAQSTVNSAQAATNTAVTARMGAAEATVNEVKLAVTDAGGAYSYYGMKVGAGGRFASIEALASTKTNISQMRFTADRLTMFDTASDVPLFDLTGAQLKLNTDLNVAAGITVGAARLKVALESIRKTGADGAAITWAGGTSIGNPPEIVLDLSTLAPLTTGEAYSVYLTGVTATGATVYAKITTPGTTAAVSQTVDAAGGAGNPTRVMSKSDSADAYDGVYNFRIVGTINIVSTYDGSLGLYIHSGYMSVSTWFNDGGGWDAGPPIVITETDVVGGYGASDLTGAQAFDLTYPVSWANAIGAGATYDFGITADYGGAVTDLHTVSYTKQTTSGTRTASPAGQTVKITAFPRNA